MHLYDSRVHRFIYDVSAGQIADILRERFKARLEQMPSDSEVRSWHHSLGAFADAIVGQGMDNAWVVLEYQLPLSSSRVDCIVVGTDAASSGQAVLVEFKQWQTCQPSYVPEVVQLGNVDHLHPSAQVRAYRQYLLDTHPLFEDEMVGLHSCAYLHNILTEDGSGFYDTRYADLLADSPAFSLSTIDALSSYIATKTGEGAPEELVEALLRGQYRPSKELLEHVAAAIDNYEPWQLLDGQRIIYNRIFAEIEQARQTGHKRTIIVKGGPGTGKSVIALQVVGAAARRHYSVAHATGSKAFTTNLRGIVQRTAPFLYTHNFRDEHPGSIDLIVCDEAHRLRQKTQFGPRVYSRRPQAEEIIDAARVSVFLLDQQQSVRNNEVGSVFGIQDYAESQGVPVQIYDLNTQFRCSGSESYIRWVEYMFGLPTEPTTAWLKNEEYEVKVFDDVAKMEQALRAKQTEGQSVRMVAGFCWEWSDPNPDGSLVKDVKIGTWQRPWNRKPNEMKRKGKGSQEKPEVHPYTIWANEDSGFGEIGCIYSAQGFEFDYVGVIVGKDYKWDAKKRQWVPHLGHNVDKGFKMGITKDKALAAEKLAHVYRVLATRGMKGTYFYFLDEETRHYFEAALAA